MPYGDRTGPEGRGSLTGRRAGYCAGNDRPGSYENGFGFGAGRGFGLGRGRGRGGGRGFGRFSGFFQAPQNYPVVRGYDQDYGNIPEEDILKQQQSWLQNQLESISRRIEELLSTKEKK